MRYIEQKLAEAAANMLRHSKRPAPVEWSIGEEAVVMRDDIVVDSTTIESVDKRNVTCADGNWYSRVNGFQNGGMGPLRITKKMS